MAGHLTLALIKPRIHQARKVGSVVSAIEQAGFSIMLGKNVQMLPDGAEQFYEHVKDQPNYQELRNSLLTGPCWVLVLGKPNAVEEWQKVMVVLPAELREHIHGSEHDWAAKREINFFFNREIRLADAVEKRTAK